MFQGTNHAVGSTQRIWFILLHQVCDAAARVLRTREDAAPVADSPFQGLVPRLPAVRLLLGGVLVVGRFAVAVLFGRPLCQVESRDLVEVEDGTLEVGHGALCRRRGTTERDGEK